MLELKTLSNRWLAIAVIGIALLLVLLSIISTQYTNRMVSQYSSLVATSIEIKNEITTSHLWFEEIISGDENASIETVWNQINNASRHISLILKNTSELSETYAPGNLHQIQQDLGTTEKHLAQFREITQQRLNAIEDAGIGSDIEQKYDAIYINLINDIEKISNALSTLKQDDLEQFNLIQNLLIVLILIAASVIGFLLYRYQKYLIALFEEQREINLSLTKSKVRLQDIAFCAGDWIWEIDASCHYTYASEKVTGIIGYTPEEMIGRYPYDLMSAEESERTALIIKDIMAKQEKITDLENWKMHKNGKAVCLRTNGVPIFNAEGELSGYRGVDKDVTEQKNMDNLLQRTQKVDALGKLTDGIAHDFNNLLGVIIGYSELLVDNIPDDVRLNKYVHQIYNAAERAKKLTSKLLTFSRKTSLSAEETDINQMLRDDQHMLEKTLTPRIKLHYELEVDLWHVYLEKSALLDSILNISINSMHAITDTGSLTIKTQNITLDTEDIGHLNIKPGDYVVVSFLDTGTGMDESTLLKVFDPFFTTKGNLGLGLGLSQVYGFIQQSGGGISISSRLDHGTRIMIYLPRFIATSSAVLAPDSADTSWDYSGDETILVVDDESALCEMAEEILSNHGYKVLLAENGNRALEILEDEHIDLLFSDVIMPEMDGYELASRVRDNYPDVKIQMTSGFSDLRHKSGFNEELHHQRLPKPYGAKILLHKIRLLLDEKSTS